MTVCIVDDDTAICRSLERLLRSNGMSVKTFDSPRSYLETTSADETACLVLDVMMPELDGFAVQEGLMGSGVPIILMSAHADVPIAVRAMKAGALDFLAKPFAASAMLSAVERAVQLRREHEREAHTLQAHREAFASLTPREREVLVCVVSGMLNKQIASQLGISEKTVKVHRARVLDKMGAQSLPDLVRMYDLLERAG